MALLLLFLSISILYDGFVRYQTYSTAEFIKSIALFILFVWTGWSIFKEKLRNGE